VELIGVADEAVRLCLHQNGAGYPDLEILRSAIEEAVGAAAPDVRLIDFVGPGAAGNATTPRVPLPVLARP
jgi:hypothetical protein